MTLGNMRDLGAQRLIASCLLTNAIKCKRGLREMNALNCPPCCEHSRQLKARYGASH